MYHDFSYQAILAASHRAMWEIEDVIGASAALDFSRPFLPESLARTVDVPALSAWEQLTLNQIRGHEYLSIFGLVEEFILPFVLDHARPHLSGDDHRVRALLQFASEEAKHIHLFKRFQQAFTTGFWTPCAVIGPAQAIADAVLGHDPLAVALAILQIEWMTQRHYIESVRDDAAIDPLFASLLRHHWMEEAQHARMDTLMVEALADGRSEAELDAAFDGYLAIGGIIDAGLRTQTELNLHAFEAAIGRTLSAEHRDTFVRQQHQAARGVYLGSGMSHPRFRATLAAIAPSAARRLDAIAPSFC